jgi:hypothetical protein
MERATVLKHVSEPIVESVEGKALRTPKCRGADPHHSNADQDPAFHFSAYPDPSFDCNPDSAFHFNSNPDPAFHSYADPDQLFTLYGYGTATLTEWTLDFSLCNNFSMPCRYDPYRTIQTHETRCLHLIPPRQSTETKYTYCTSSPRTEKAGSRTFFGTAIMTPPG